MAQANRVLSSALPTSKPDTARQLWRDCWSMSRRMMKPRGDGFSVSDAELWYGWHARRRFGDNAAAFMIVDAARSLAYSRHCLLWPTSGTISELIRQGLLRTTKKPRAGNLCGVVADRAARFDRQREHGLNMVFGFDRLAAGGLRRGERAWAVRRRRAERAAEAAALPSRRAAAAVIAAEKAGVSIRYALTVTGALVLSAAEARERVRRPMCGPAHLAGPVVRA
jgi:hypothetical protein